MVMRRVRACWLGALARVGVLARRRVRLSSICAAGRKQQVEGEDLVEVGIPKCRLPNLGSRVEGTAGGEGRLELLRRSEVGLVDEDDVGRLDLDEEQLDDTTVDGAWIELELVRTREVGALTHFLHRIVH